MKNSKQQIPRPLTPPRDKNNDFAMAYLKVRPFKPFVPLETIRAFKTIRAASKPFPPLQTIRAASKPFASERPADAARHNEMNSVRRAVFACFGARRRMSFGKKALAGFIRQRLRCLTARATSENYVPKPASSLARLQGR